MQRILKGIESWRAKRTRYFCNSVGLIVENIIEKNKVLEVDLNVDSKCKHSCNLN